MALDLNGKRFGRLTIIKRVENRILPSGQKRSQWLCKCDCGNYATVLGYMLTSGNTQSCGCLHDEAFAKARKKYNTYDLSGEYEIGYTSNGNEFWFDLEDYDKIKDYCWTITNNGYVSAYNPKNRNRVLLHRIIMECDNTEVYIDHKHGEKSRFDNRKSNLRIATPNQNAMNRVLLQTNTSGVTGVSFNKKRDKWEAYIGIDNKRINLGRFNDFEDAVSARKEAEEKYFGEWSYDNSQKDVPDNVRGVA